MAYGDGGFFFTQPVGNGYSGLGAFGASMVKGATPGMRSSSISSYCLSDGAVCTSAELKAEMDRIAAIWSARGLTMAQRRASPWWPTFTALRRKYYQLTTVPTLPSGTGLMTGAQFQPSTASTSASSDTSSEVATDPGTEYDLEYWASQSGSGGGGVSTMPMPMLSAEQVEEMGLMVPDDVMTVSSDMEESEGIMGWIQSNPLLAAGLAAGAGYAVYRYAKQRGMF